MPLDDRRPPPFPTVDQQEPTPQTASLQAEPFLEVLFHADISFWGTVTPPGALRPRTATRVGRFTLLVAPWAPQNERLLGDPCLSRDLLDITFTGKDFQVEVLSDRRPVTLRRPDGTTLLPGERLRPGTRVIVEDRLVLSLEHRISPVAWHAWYRDGYAAESARDAAPEMALGLVGESEALWRLRQKILALPPGPNDVFLQGETGAGKELVAAAVHRHVRGVGAPYATVNCASIPGSLFESELFGYTAGAFSGAAREGRRGAFREADGGTLFLDEIAELPLDAQAKLNRVIESRRVQPVGARHTEAYPVDVLMVYATWQDLGTLVAQGRFRADLMNRCQRLFLEVPPLRARAQDVPRLVRHLLAGLRQRYLSEAGPSDAAVARRNARLGELFQDPESRRPSIELVVLLRLMEHGWDEGNVRSLYNAVQQSAFCFLAGDGFDPGPLVANRRAAPPENSEGQAKVASPPRAHKAERSRPPDAIPAAEWRAAYDELGSVRKVASRFGFSVSTADKYLKLSGADVNAPNLAGQPRSTPRS